MMRTSCMGLGVTAVLLALPTLAAASSHRDAPYTSADPYADNTDVYAFLDGSAGQEQLVLLANWMPFLEPDSGPNFWRFADDVTYACHFDNNGDASTDVSYYFDFQTQYTNPDSFLYNVGPISSPDDPDLQFQTKYTIIRGDWKYGDGGSFEGIDTRVVADGLQQAPWYVGDASFPTPEAYDDVARQSVRYVEGEGTFFAGPRREYFYLDLAQTFDLLSLDATAENTLRDDNVMTIAMQLPIERVAFGGKRPDAQGDPEGTDLVGVYCNSGRRTTRILGGPRDDFDQMDTGKYVAVSRLGLPLINEVLVGVGTKDRFNRSAPWQDVETIGAFVLDPELPYLLEALLGAECQDPPRNDLLALISPFGTTPADLLRLNIRADQTAEDSALPNGRRPEDDAFDVMASAACDATALPLPVPISDGVGRDDLPPLMSEFPYLPRPLSATARGPESD